MHRAAAMLLGLAALAVALPAKAQVPVTLYRAFAGDVNYVITGGSLRSAPNSGAGADACAVGSSSTSPLSGIPGGSTVRAAFLYWAGSYNPGNTAPDYNVSLNGVAHGASRTFTETFNFGGTAYDFFSGFADVTAQVAATGNGSYTLGSLSVHSGSPHCGSQAVLAGWSLVVIYDNPVTERLRVLNVFDGFQFFRGSALTLTLANFRATASPDGRLSVVTWEGDVENSAPLGGFSESLTLNGSVLSDAFNPGNNQFNSTVNTIASSSSYGVDVDTYTVDALVSPGDTTATSVYSSGGDLVLLSAQVASFASDPLVDLSLTKTHSGDFVAGNEHEYTIVVSNDSDLEDPGTITVNDSLPTGLSFVSAAGGAWGCSAAGQDVSCTHTGTLAPRSTLPPLTLRVAVDERALPSVDNTATVSTTSYDPNPGNDSATDTATVVGPDLSGSTKSVLDLNGGDVEPGDTLRYTIRLVESAGLDAADIRVNDDIPALLGDFRVTAIPPGAADSSTGAGTGAGGAGYLDVSAIAVPASSAVTIVFEGEVIGGAQAGDVIRNVATVSNPNGADAAPAAPELVVRASQLSAGGIKTLYLFDDSSADPNGFDAGTPPYLSRTPPSSAQSDVTVDKDDPPVVWTMTPALQAPLAIQAGNVPVTLWVSKGGGGGSAQQRELQLSLASTGASSGPIGAPASVSFAAPPSGSPLQLTVLLPVAADVALAAGSQITLTVHNTTAGGGSRRVRVFPFSAGNHSRVEIDVTPVIDVDAVTIHDAAWPGGTPVSALGPGQTAYLRAQISDPFGSFDIAAVTVDLTDSTGAPQLSDQQMVRVLDSGNATALYEYPYTIPDGPQTGTWTVRVTALEGTEGTVSDSDTGNFLVALPDLLMFKNVQIIGNVHEGTVNAKAIPGATMQYSITVTNQGRVATDNDSVVVTDVLPPGTSLYVDRSATDPVAFVDGAVASGLSYDFSTDVAFSDRPGGVAPFSYTPVADAEGFDSAVTAVRISPRGALGASTATGAPSFTLRLMIRVD